MRWSRYDVFILNQGPGPIVAARCAAGTWFDRRHPLRPMNRYVSNIEITSQLAHDVIADEHASTTGIKWASMSQKEVAKLRNSLP